MRPDMVPVTAVDAPGNKHPPVDSAIPAAGQPHFPELPSLSAAAQPQEPDPTIAMASVEVKTCRPVAYRIRAIQSSQNPAYGTLVLMHDRTGNTGGGLIRWLEPGHWNQRIVQIEGRDAASLTLREAFDAINHGAEPVHITLNSSQGMRTVECYSRSPDAPDSPQPAQSTGGPLPPIRH
ncbi:MAG TPA: hypothetical protein VMC06_07550 [Opitutaceae bacterium]|nr:hypothetical protein [Opitutaceae bacterium]